MLALALGLGSTEIGLALARLHPILFPAATTAAIYPVYLADLRGRSELCILSTTLGTGAP
ncbi:MAG: hypothetical protein QI223_10835 [Candidatus Korarchaeota archaeon]|nr:hypothetical protein [Candidatus Korarchaeota archaeon]